MILQIIGGIIRAVLAAYGGKLVESGYMSGDDLNQIIGAVLVLVTIGWSVWQKHRSSTVPGGPFNAAAEVRRAKSTPESGSSEIRALLFLVVLFTLVGSSLILGGLISEDVRVSRYSDPIAGPVPEIVVTKIEDKRPFLRRLWSSLHVCPSLAVVHTDTGEPSRIVKIELVGGTEF